MKRRYRIRNTSVGYLPQVKYGWLPWCNVGNFFFWLEEDAQKACDKHNASKERVGGECYEYIPEPLTNDQ